MKRLYLILVFLFILIPACSFTSIRVIDGDTIVYNGDSVRYLGIDTPERGEPYYAEAKSYNINLLNGREVSLEKDITDKDKYGRLLRYVYADAIFVNAEIVRQGFAFVYRENIFVDNKYYDILRSALEEAVSNKKGIWGMQELHPKYNQIDNYYLPETVTVN